MPKDIDRAPEPDVPPPDPASSAASKSNSRAWPSVAGFSPISLPASNASDRTRTPDSGDHWTVGRLLNWTTDYLKKRGSESPRLDTEVLLAHVLGWQRVQLYTHHEDEVGRKARA